MVALLVAACAGQRYEPTYGFVLETLYPDGIPDEQQRYLGDGRLTEDELDQATRASNECATAVPGVESVEPFRWDEQEGDFAGGDVTFTDDADRDEALEAARACYLRHMGLIEYAWLDQFHFGEWTEENLRD